ncbi:DUF2380 domain-containing protein [Glaciimonas sp. CA11.2]|uniref:DUF2380 domain-containing protein n=1 Tax=Glaciimonas sp. CA11.2 TaxID=3048601 RepID=UPI002AB47047|nr:DUF2380 domain-containing protein [Glaciimonas sp. CA11.2]MDY7545836.1 DUF2380 domain-containing protein [Glaciimonas sp. CA11.2]MEB0161862.1 DUF2380 domain-containing protein [Glaciimonas sp. CA11.2]
MHFIFSTCRQGLLVILLSLVPAIGVFAAGTPIAILDFELNDLTLNLTANPVNPEEVVRTSTLQSLLKNALIAKGGYTICAIDSPTQEKANAGLGYLYGHPDVAAELGQSVGADWIVVGRLHKASFLFVYLKAQLINTKTKQVVEQYSVEIKGQQNKITPKGVDRLAQQINDTIRSEASQPHL